VAPTVVPTTISELFQTVRQGAANIARHREAMAQVAALAKAKQPAQPQAGGETK
jgi:hypothetical protein